MPCVSPLNGSPRPGPLRVESPLSWALWHNNSPQNVHLLNPNPVDMPLGLQKELCRGDEGKDLEMRRLFWATWAVRHDHSIRRRGKQEVQSQRE